ncbi:hypothetical protein LTR78_001656 [Recurvomyces mirabilis]|uniref:Uncharacterized protein n=2 Tax=Recurvomyces mirabilis TaxID=574656 RepID=A0AAE0WV25_9PEZI|nr:hypothetical protein LTR78_001656 [Recurvomyces mirabilis]
MADIDMATLPNGLRILTIHAKGSAFLDLPRELRDLIYHEVLTEQPLWHRRHLSGCAFRDLNADCERPVFMPLNIHLEDNVPWHDIEACEELCRTRKDLGLQRVNRQISHETEGLFWKRNTFCYDDAGMLLLDIGPQKPNNAIRNPWAGTRRQTMPQSVRLKIRNLSFTSTGWLDGISPEIGEGILRALHNLPGLTSVELPPTIWHKNISALNGQPLPHRLQCSAGTLRRIFVGPTYARLYLHMAKRIRASSCDREPAGHKKRCVWCRLDALEIQLQMARWSDRSGHSVLGSEIDLLSGELVTRALRRSVPAHPGTVAPYRMVVKPKEGVEQEVTIYGLPILDASGRHKRQIHARLANVRASTAALKDRRLRSALVGDDDIEDLIPVKHTVKKVNDAPTVC